MLSKLNTCRIGASPSKFSAAADKLVPLPEKLLSPKTLVPVAENRRGKQPKSVYLFVIPLLKANDEPSQLIKVYLLAQKVSFCSKTSMRLIRYWSRQLEAQFLAITSSFFLGVPHLVLLMQVTKLISHQIEYLVFHLLFLNFCVVAYKEG